MVSSLYVPSSWWCCLLLIFIASFKKCTFVRFFVNDGLMIPLNCVIVLWCSQLYDRFVYLTWCCWSCTLIDSPSSKLTCFRNSWFSTANNSSVGTTAASCRCPTSPSWAASSSTAYSAGSGAGTRSLATPTNYHTPTRCGQCNTKPGTTGGRGSASGCGTGSLSSRDHAIHNNIANGTDK